MYALTRLALVFAAGLGLVACGGGTRASDGDADGDADAAADADAADGDADGDADLDADVDADGDSDGECVPRCAGRECGPDSCGGFCPPGCGPARRCSADGACEPVSDCHAWPDGTSLQVALDSHDCVEIQAGTHALDGSVNIPAGRELRGVGRDHSVLVPSDSFSDTALLVTSRSDVHMRWFRVRGDVGAGARLNLVVVGAETRNVVMEELMVDGAECDGLSMGGEGTIIRDSILSNNGHDCPPIGTGSAIYAEGNVTIPGGQFSHAPQIIGNTIEDNPLGSGIDMAEVSDGRISGNTIRDNGANGGISIYHGHGWTIEDNHIENSGGWRNFGHPTCEGPHSPATIAIKLCRDADILGGTDGNVIRNNRAIGYYGILLAGDDESAPYLVPRFNVITGNDVSGSTVGCLDDFRPGQWVDGDNEWSGNNCGGAADTGPEYF